jgi:hypothetical protein
LELDFKGEKISADHEWYEGGGIVLMFGPDPNSPARDKPSSAAYAFCAAYGEFLKDGLIQMQRRGTRPLFNKHPF